MDTTQDNEKEDEPELMREVRPADLDRLQRDLSEPDDSDGITGADRMGGNQPQ